MVHYLNDREPWSRQGEQYLRKIRSEPPVHPPIATTRATQKARAESREARPAA